VPKSLLESSAYAGKIDFFYCKNRALIKGPIKKEKQFGFSYPMKKTFMIWIIGIIY